MSRAIEAVLAQPWGITDEALETIVAVAEREHEFASGNLEALEKRLGRPLGNTEVATVRDGVAIIPVEGPLFAKANLMTRFSGATSYDILARDFDAALNDPAVSAIILKHDSPGGVVDGASQFAQQVREARGKKPIVSFVSGASASADYWIASAADKIIAADTARIGSIGVQIGVRVTQPKAGEKNFRFVSSQSPMKNADIETEAGAQEVQRTIDALANVFIEAVAVNRGVEADTVLKSYGKGAVFVAAEALSRGMIDGIGTFESVLQSVKQESTSMDYASLTAESLAENRPDLVQAISAQAKAGIPDAEAIKAAAVTAERERIAAIEALSVPGAEDLIAKFRAEGTAPADAAMQIVKHMQASANKQGEDYLAAVQSAEKEMTPPKTVNGGDDKATSANADIDAIMADAKAAGVKV